MSHKTLNDVVNLDSNSGLKPSSDIGDSWHIPPSPFPEIQLMQNCQMNDEELGIDFIVLSHRTLNSDRHRRLASELSFEFGRDLKPFWESFASFNKKVGLCKR